MNTTRLIEGFLEGSLDDDERIRFENTVLADSRLSSLVKLHDEVNRSISDTGLHRLKMRLEEITILYKRKNRSLCFLAFAAALVCLAALAICFKFLFLPAIDPHSLFEKYYQPYSVDFITRSDLNSSVFSQGIMEYQSGNYGEALQKFSVAGEEDVADINMLYFYRGLAYMGNGEYGKACHMLGCIPDSWNRPFKVHRDWYLALAYIATERPDMAQGFLSELASDKGIYSGDASKILRKIRRPL